MKITTKDIQVGFHARQILKGISIESKDKELVGIIGPNALAHFLHVTQRAV